MADGTDTDSSELEGSGLSQAQIDDFKREHGDDLLLLTNPRTLLFRRAPAVTWADFQESIAKVSGGAGGGQLTNAFRRLCYQCRVYPEQKELESVFREYPALPTKIAKAIGDISGQGDEFDVKKL